jgi:peptidoglycan/xylan/chitin deacetylase (PgdA/CDA1 family)
VDKVSSTYHIRVQLTFEKSFLLQWELDTYTATHLLAITQEAGSIKYRLSLHSYYNDAHKYFYSYITTYHRENSHKIMFLCSEAYAIKISSLKEIEHPDQLNLISPVILEQHISMSHDEAVVSKRNSSLKFSRVKRLLSKALITTMIIAILSITYIPNYSYISEKVFAKFIKVLPDLSEPAQLNPIVQFENNEVDHSSISLENMVEASSSTKKPSANMDVALPSFMTMDKPINFRVPAGFVALTFDDGPSIYTKDIINVLNKYNVGGTFFFVGTNVKKFPESVKYVSDNGFSIGNHSMTHANLSNQSITKQLSELEQTNQLIQNITSQPVTLVRPPYGAYDDRFSNLMNKENMRMVLWNSDPEDWNNNSSQHTLDYIYQTRSDGAIILLHESRETLKILPFIIEYLQTQQLKIVNLM